MFIERKAYILAKKHLSSKQITVITGIRRSGKTTIVKRLLDDVEDNNKIYLDLERLDIRELFAEKNYDNVVNFLIGRGLDFKKKVYIGLDEIQLVSQSASVLKYLYDHYNIKFIATGSSSFYLKNLFTDSLAGRKKIIELYPLDFDEFLKFKGIKHVSNPDFLKTKFSQAEHGYLKVYYDEYIKFGGFPEVVLANNSENKKDLLADIISSYINVDIKNLSDFRDSRDIYNLIKLLAGRVGSRIDNTKLSSHSGLSRHTVANYLELFEKSYLIHRVSVLAKKADREIVKAKKIYFCDTGLANSLANLNSGEEFENTVYLQLRSRGDLRYFSLKTGREIDFIFNNNFALEAKETPTKHDYERLSDLAKQAGINSIRLIGHHPSPKFSDYIWGGDIR